MMDFYFVLGGLCFVSLVLGCALVVVTVCIVSSQMSSRGR